MGSFMKRNMLIYFRDKATVFFSLLSVFILIGLYVLFLGDFTANALPDFPSKKPMLTMWFVAGVLAVASMTTTLGALGIFVEDRANNVELDFRSSPIARSKLIGGYLSSALFIGIFICIIAFLTSLIFLYVTEQATIAFTTFLQLLGVIFLAVLASGSIALFLVSFFRTLNAFAAMSTIVGTLLGFVAGIYIPIGNLPEYLQTIVKIFPISHAAALFRQLLMDSFLLDAFAKAPAEQMENFQYTMGVLFEVKGEPVSKIQSMYYLLLTSALFLSAALFQMYRKKQ